MSLARRSAIGLPGTGESLPPFPLHQLESRFCADGGEGRREEVDKAGVKQVPPLPLRLKLAIEAIERRGRNAFVNQVGERLAEGVASVLKGYIGLK